MSRRTAAKNKFHVLLLIFFIFGFLTCFNNTASASSTDGTIDSTYKYVWGENIGWVNFGTSNGDVHITDSALSGYALSDTVGWIYLSDIVNDGDGNLSGYAWGENTGFIKFDPTNGGVIINSSGEFTGSALGEDVGWIIFDGDYSVKTDWRPRSARAACNNASDDDGDGSIDYPADPGCSSLDDTDETDTAATPSGGSGGGLPPEAYYPPTVPEDGFSILINNNAVESDSRKVTLSLKGGVDTKIVWISENAQFPERFQISYNLSYPQNSVPFTFSEGDGTKTVYAKYCTQWGRCSEIVSDDITIIEKTLIEIITEVPKTIIEKIEDVPEFLKPDQPKTEPDEIPKTIVDDIKRISDFLKPLVPEFLKPDQPKTEPDEIPIEETVTKEAPLVFQGKWQLLPDETISEFVLAPLPKGIQNLVQKFPELEKTLEKIDVRKITDVAKLNSVELTLPGLAKRVGLPIANIEPGNFNLPKGVPVAEFSPAIKQQLPTEIVFARTGGEFIDFDITLSVSDEGEPKQKIVTISGKPIQLVMKPENPVKSIKGYMVFKSRASQPTSLEFPLHSLLTSAILFNPVFAKTQHQPVRVEEKLVLFEFEYTDPDGDGIYTAEIQAPLAEGEYEIITVMEFDDSELGKKEIRLTAVVDPEGYVYERDGNKETRIPGAIISLFWLNPKTERYELWPAKEYQQENPQTTDVKGTYSFLVPEGKYYLKAETSGYLVYNSKPFPVIEEGGGIHINIELKAKYWWLHIVDWRTILLAIFITLSIYNFFHEKRRD